MCEEEEDPLELLLSAANEVENVDNNAQCESQPKPTLQLLETDIFSESSSSKTTPKNLSLSLIHSGETDSSDDEDNKYQSKYNSFGKDIKHLLQTDSEPYSPSEKSTTNGPKTWKSKQAPTEQPNIITDPFFGIRISKPLISSAALRERMAGREAVPHSRLKLFLERSNLKEKDWVVAGVVVSKVQKTTQKDKPFCIWTLSDLHVDMKTVCIMLFDSAHKEFWKLCVGSVVAILNPSVLERKPDSKHEGTLSVNNAQRIMTLGMSKDLGFCKSRRKDGEKCTSFVNLNVCEYCIYHIKQEYQKCSGRSELQSSFSGRGLTALRNKVLGKNEVFYAGKSYTAVPLKKSKKQTDKDENRLKFLNSKITNSVDQMKKPQITSLEVKKRDLELLKKLEGKQTNSEKANGLMLQKSADVSLDESKKLALSVISKLKSRTTENDVNTVNEDHLREKTDNIQNTDAPKPTTSFASNPIFPALQNPRKSLVDLSSPLRNKRTNLAKLNAIMLVKTKGPIEKSDPNSVRSKKRPLNSSESQPDSKKPKPEGLNFKSERFLRMMQITSKNSDLTELNENDQQETYFKKLELKERLEDKMQQTYKVPCKAVRCVECKYTSFSAAESCKTQRHRLKVFDAFKRFFKCADCKTRTCCLEIVPLVSCKNCGGSKWEKTTMMKETVVKMGPTLSIRGDEQKAINSCVVGANLDLIVAD